MNYTILKQWRTNNGEYHSMTVDKSSYDSAIGEFHSMFKPMQNDTNVSYFRFLLIDEFGHEVASCSWERQEEETAV